MAWRGSSSPRGEVAGLQPGGASAGRSVKTWDGWQLLLLLVSLLLLLGGRGEGEGPVVPWWGTGLPDTEGP